MNRPYVNPNKENIIRRIAYRIYQERERNGEQGSEKEDWALAEEEYERAFE